MWLDVKMPHLNISIGGRRTIGLVAVVLSFALAGPAAAQSAVTVGDTGPASGDFAGTDEACGFGSYTDDSYVAELGEDETGVYIEFTQGSTGDTGRFRSDADGNITFDTGGDEAYVDIDVEGEALFALYRYTSGDCTQEWIATVTLPPGFIEALIAGNATPPEPESTEPPTTEPEATEPSTTEPETTEPAVAEPASDDGGGGFDLLDLGLWGVLVALAAFLPWGTYRFLFGPKRLFRADHGDPGVFIDDEVTITTGFDIDNPFDDEPTENGPATPGVIVDEDETLADMPVPLAPPEQDNCVPEREEFMSAQEAKEVAFAAGEHADAELAEAKAQWGRLEAAIRNPLGDRPPVADVDANASSSEQARQRRLHELNVTEWQRFEDEATEAKGQLDAARARLDKARVDSAEAWQDFQRMRARLEAARVALDNCDGSAPPVDETDVGTGGSDADGGQPSGGSPGIVTPPPATDSDPSDEDSGCTEDAEKDGKVISSTAFSILGGPITVDVGTTAWTRAGKTFSAEDFAALETSRVEELSAGIEQGRRSVRISVEIPTTILTVKCLQVLVCDHGQWVDSGKTRRIEERADANPIIVLPTGADGSLGMAKDRKLAGNMVDKAKVEIETLQENQETANNMECGE